LRLLLAGTERRDGTLPMVDNPSRHIAELWEPLDWYDEAPAEYCRVLVVRPATAKSPFVCCEAVTVPGDDERIAIDSLRKLVEGDVEYVEISRGCLGFRALVDEDGMARRGREPNVFGLFGTIVFIRPPCIVSNDVLLDARQADLECWKAAVTDALDNPSMWYVNGVVNNGQPLHHVNCANFPGGDL
jgi:hypothetical protein